MWQGTATKHAYNRRTVEKSGSRPVGPISPPSDSGHRYILTLFDYATRYPEAIPLKNIDTKTVAEALVDIYSRVGIPEEVLSDLGRQFVLDCMKEVSRLLSIGQLTTTPYHSMCNGLVEELTVQYIENDAETIVYGKA